MFLWKIALRGNDECGGGLRMSNFFKELALAEKKIVVENEFLNEQGEVLAYKDSTRQILLFLIQTVESGRLVGSSESGRFICKNFRKNAVELTTLWNSNNFRKKSANTFRSQVSTLSNKMYRLFGNNIYSIFCSQDGKGLQRLSTLLELLCGGENRYSDLFYVDMLEAGADSGNFPSQNVVLEDCKPELRFLRQILKVRIRELVGKLDAQKLQYIQYVLDQPLVDRKTMKLNREKADVLVALGVVVPAKTEDSAEKGSVTK
jgi:hypothetical protein